MARSTPQRVAGLLLAAGAAMAPLAPAAAHPDITIEDRVTFLFAGAAVTAIEESWTFDPEYSKTLLSDAHVGGKGELSAAESRAMGEMVLPNLEPFRYFTYVWIDGRDLGTLRPRDFLATATSGRVTFRFAVDLPAPIDPRRQALRLEINDRDYYAAIRLAAADAVRLKDAQGIACVPRLRDDKENAYFGYVYPQEITLSCR